MKSKDSPNLYEILKQSTHGATEAPPEVQPRAVATAVEPAPVEKAPSGPRIVVPPRPVPPPAPVSATPAPAGPGERSFTVTMNTAIFAGIVALGVVFLAYAIGVRAGKARGLEEAAAPATPTDADTEATDPGTAPPANKKLAIKLMEWSGKSQERLTGMRNAESMKNTLAQQGFRGAWIDPQEMRGNEPFVVLYFGKYDSRTADAREKLAALKKFRYQNRYPFAQADFVEVEP